jgi:hypothetical protein
MSELNNKSPRVVAGKKNVITIRYHLNESNARLFAERFPGYLFNVIDGATDKHPHPISATERKITEMMVYQKLEELIGKKKQIIDIGGSAIRNQTRGNVWSTCPELLTGDVIRNLKNKSRGVRKWCVHKVQDCVCVSDVCGYMAIHSLYYLSQKEILDLVSTGKPLVASMHLFDHMKGSFSNGEAQYEVTDEDNVIMQVNGNHHGYAHPLCSWIYGDYYRCDDKAMIWTREVYNDTSIITFVSTTLLKTNPTSSFSSYLNNTHASISTEHCMSINDVNVKLLGMGPFTVAVEKQGKRILVPTNLIRYGRQCVAGKPRTPTVFATLVDKLRRYVVSQSETYPAPVLVQAAEIAFNIDIPSEIGSLTNIVNSRRAYNHLNKLMTFEKPRAWGSTKLLVAGLAAIALGFETRQRLPGKIAMACGSLLTLGIIGYYNSAKNLMREKPTASRSTKLSVAALAAIYLGFKTRTRLPGKMAMACGPLLTLGIIEYYNSEKKFIKASPTKLQYELDRTSSITAETELIETLPSTTVDNTLLPVAKGGKITITPADNPDKVKNDGMVTIGPLFASHLPVVLAANQSNEITAVRNRCLMEVPKPIKGIFNLLNDRIDKEKFKNMDIISFDKWNKKFPRARRQQHVKAMTEIETCGINLSDFIRKSFVKVEKYNKSSVGEFSSPDPRLIQGVSHKANVVLGPWMQSFSKELAAQWSIKHMLDNHTNILYASGMTGEELGNWYDKVMESTQQGLWIAVLGDDMLGIHKNAALEVTYVANDFSRFDTTISVDAIHREIEIYEACGAPTDCLEVLNGQLSTKGYTRHGVKYEVLGQRKSGDPNTSCGNSLLNGMVSAHVLEKHLDDLAPDKIAASYLEYGFKAKTVVTKKITEVDFCSKLFWPVRGGTVLSAKPGRALIKMGASIRQLSDNDIASYYNAWSIDASFIAGFKPYIERAMKGRTQTKKRYYANNYSIHNRNSHIPTQATKDFFYERYDILYDDFEQSIEEAVNVEGNVVHCEMLDRLVKIDN